MDKVGHEVNFNRYLYHYQPRRSLEAIETDIRAVEAGIMALVREVG